MKLKKFPCSLCQKLCSSGTIQSYFLFLGRTQGSILELAVVRQVWFEKGSHSPVSWSAKLVEYLRAGGEICVGTVLVRVTNYLP